MIKQHFISKSTRLRSTPFSDQIEEQGVKSYTVYNHMLLPTVFESIEADAEHLKNFVQIWDVSVERQVEISGPDSASDEVSLIPYPRWQTIPLLGNLQPIYETGDRGTDNIHPGPKCHKQFANYMLDKIQKVKNKTIPNYYPKGIHRLSVNHYIQEAFESCD